MTPQGELKLRRPEVITSEMKTGIYAMKNVILHTKLVQMIQTIATKYHQQQFEMFIRRLLALNLAHTCRFGR